MLIVVAKGPVLCVAATAYKTSEYKFYSIEMPPNMNDEQQCAAHMWMVWHIRQIMATFIVVVTTLLSHPLLNLTTCLFSLDRDG